MHAASLLVLPLLMTAQPSSSQAETFPPAQTRVLLAQMGVERLADGEASAPASSAAQPEKADSEECQVAIMTLQSKGLPADQQHVAQLLTDTMAAEIEMLDACKVITQSDIAQMLDFEANKASVCTDGSDSCLAEIGGALGVDRVIVGSVGMLGSSFKLQVKLQNVAKGRVEGRVDKLIKGEAELLDAEARNAARSFFEKTAAPAAAASPPAAGSTSTNEPVTTAAAQETADRGSPDARTTGESDAADTQNQETSNADEGRGLSTVLLSVGLVGAGAGVVAVIAAGIVAGGIEVVLGVPLEATQSLNPVKGVLPFAGIGALGAVALGTVVLIVGTGVAAAGLFVE